MASLCFTREVGRGGGDFLHCPSDVKKQSFIKKIPVFVPLSGNWPIFHSGTQKSCICIMGVLNSRGARIHGGGGGKNLKKKKKGIFFCIFLGGGGGRKESRICPLGRNKSSEAGLFYHLLCCNVFVPLVCHCWCFVFVLLWCAVLFLMF